MPLVKKWQLDEHIEKTPIDHPDRSVTSGKLEYPTEDVTFLWLILIGKAYYIRHTKEPLESATAAYMTTDSFTDKSLKSFWRDGSGAIYRWQNVENMYGAVIQTWRVGEDFRVNKRVAGVWTLLGSEAVDLEDLYYLVKISIEGTTINAYRQDMTTPKITVTDTTFSSGQFGTTQTIPYINVFSFACEMLAPSSEPLKTLGYFVTPLTGDGTDENPYRALLPEKIETHPDYGETNAYALSHSSLIPTDKGIPKYDYCLVRIFDQPERQPHLAEIDKCIRILKRMDGVRQLTLEEAIKLALKMDPKLTLKDLENWL